MYASAVNAKMVNIEDSLLSENINKIIATNQNIVNAG